MFHAIDKRMHVGCCAIAVVAVVVVADGSFGYRHIFAHAKTTPCKHSVSHNLIFVFKQKHYFLHDTLHESV